VNLYALAAATVYAAYLVGYALYHVVGSPYEMGIQLYSDSLGFAILQGANRHIALDTTDARIVLLGALAVGVALLLAPRWLSGRSRLAAGSAAVLALLIISWNVTGEIAAAAGTVSLSRHAGSTLRHPFSWVDAVAGGKPTLFMGQGVADQNAEWLLEFWNRSITTVSSIDGSVVGPGPAGGPNLTADGKLAWDQQFAYAVEDWPCVDFAGALRTEHPYSAGGTTRIWRLISLTTPNRLRSMCTGLYADGWSGANDAAYFRFAGGKPGWLHVVVSRRDWDGPSDPSPVHLLVGKLVINANHQPILGRLTETVDTTIDSTQTRDCWIRTPSGRFAAHVVVDRKFVPNDVLHNGDARTLGAQTSFSYVSERPSGTQSTCR
jgi:hypothetical protein